MHAAVLAAESLQPDCPPHPERDGIPVGAASIIPFPKWPRLATAGGHRPPPPPPGRPKRVPAQVHRLRRPD
jgi:hypothetical protein